MEPTAPNVSEDLMKRMHDANARLHDARLGVERAMEGSDYRHQQRVNDAEDHLQKVQKDLEEIDRAIQAALHPSPPASQSTH